MNDFAEIEGELKKLRPTPASENLLRRVEVELARPAVPAAAAGVIKTRRKFSVNWLALGLGAAAAAGFLLLARLDVEQPSPNKTTLAAITPAPLQAAQQSAGSALLPTGMTQVVYQTRDEGLLFTEGAERPVRRTRTQARETLHWRDPSDGALIRITYPSEEVTLTPVAGQ